MQTLVRTPDRHEPTVTRAPTFKPSNRTCLQVAGLQELAKAPGHSFGGKCETDTNCASQLVITCLESYINVYGHIMLKAPVLVRSLKLSLIELC